MAKRKICLSRTRGWKSVVSVNGFSRPMSTPYINLLVLNTGHDRFSKKDAYKNTTMNFDVGYTGDIPGFEDLDPEQPLARGYHQHIHHIEPIAGLFLLFEFFVALLLSLAIP